MKQVLKIIVSLLALVISTQSCSFLTEEPRSGHTAEEVIVDAVSLHQQAVLSLYNYIGSATDGEGLQGTYRGVYDLQTFASDEAIIPTRGGDWQDGGLWLDLYKHEWTSTNEVCANAWLYLYQLVGRCNRSLTLLKTYSSLTDAATLTQDSAEIRAVRAMAYMYLVDLFGRVPIVTIDDTPLVDVKQSKRSEVFWFVIRELQDVLWLLPDERSNAAGEYYGRITRPVVLFLLMKTALNAEVWTDDDLTDEKRPDGSAITFICDGLSMNSWETVIYYANILDQSATGPTLDGSQTECFQVHNIQSMENIFTIPVDQSNYLNRFKNQFRSLHYQHGAALGYAGENGSCATQATLDVFGYPAEEDGDKSAIDPRFRLAFFYDTVKVNGVPLTLSDGSTLVYHPRAVMPDLSASPLIATAGARMYKYAIDPTGIFDGQLRQNDIVLFRYADVLLMRAEAKVRNSENGQSDFDLVRMRQEFGGDEIVPREATLDNIYLERWLELVWEGWHRQDQIRFNRYTRETEVFPIPETAIETNSHLTQNPGY